MADTSSTLPLWRRWKPDWAWIAVGAIPLAVAVLAPDEVRAIVTTSAGSFLRTLPYILIAVTAVAYMKAAGAETLLSRAFEGREVRMILLAALMGGLSPFCSCQVIPFIAALLAVGAPLSAVMAFWLSSPLMDPGMFAVTAGALGFDFAIGKTVVAVAMGLFGGFTVRAFSRSALFADPLKHAPKPSCSSCCGDDTPFQGRPVWRFWPEPERRATFRASAFENLMFLGKWLALAYLLEALMLRYVPADLVGHWLGGEGVGPIVLGAVIGAPAYLNGYGAVPLVAGLIEQGMSQGAAMAFVVAGGVSCIPAAVAVWALVKPRVFAAYLGFAVVGAIIAGMAWSMVA